MKKLKFIGLFLSAIIVFKLVSSQESYVEHFIKRILVPDKWQPFQTIKEHGLLGERIDLWRNKRLWYVQNSDFLLEGFETRPGKHEWQGEHVGKWLHAATLGYEVTKDEKLKKALDKTVERLLDTQLPNGYMGTYDEGQRFYVFTDAPKGWDIWTHRYNLYGLLTYEKFHPNKRVIDACKKIGDLLIDTYGEGKADITKYGTRQGISSTTLLESVVMLYERTSDAKYLKFAEQIVVWSEQNPGLRLMDAMLKKESVVNSGDGKAYQLMANLLGYLRLYQNTGNNKYLQTVLNGWEQIQEKHVLVTGGPWTRKMAYNGNKECFAKTDAFEPNDIVIENCCTVTWIQLNLQLSGFTGQVKYMEEAEKTMFNHFFGGQHSDGIDWCYYTKPNEVSPPYVSTMHCCASSGPRALEMFSAHMIGSLDNNVSINHFSPSEIALTDKFGGGNLRIKSNFPFNSSAEIILETKQVKEFPVEFRLPHSTDLVSVKINGKIVEAIENKRGYFQVSNKWGKGDVITINIKYKLQLHVQEVENRKKWIAFSYGPIALAQKITQKQTEEPFKKIKAEFNKPEKILSMLSKAEESSSSLVFTIQNTGIILVPYYQTGSKNSGPRTYFEFSDSD